MSYKMKLWAILLKSSQIVCAGTLLFTVTGCASKSNNGETVKTTYVHQYGPEVKDSEDWESRGANGQIIHTLKNGVVAKETYRDGKLHGISTLTFPHSDTIQSERFYDNGSLVWQTVNFTSGMPQRQENYEKDNVVTVTSWYEDGSPATKEEYKKGLLMSGQYFKPNQELESEVKDYNGSRVVRDSLGVLQARESIVNGQLAMREQFYPNGMPLAYTHYINGKVNGVRKTFNPGGDPKSIEEWRDGNLNGIALIFENGEKISEVPYVNGQKEGIEKKFRKGTEIVVEEISWKSDMKHGPSYVYVEEKTFTDWYFEGKKVSKAEYTQLDRGSTIAR